ncbi:MAG: RecQ family ATP-dependent DNA helicase [Bacteroidales bacterium]|nr:RecQ family ATP-dependent DNA helicase [Bacteroidales bacterium]
MDKYQKILTKYWGYPNFRPLQDDIIKSIGQGKDTLALMPTGGGKSITFQVPALAEEGLCIVVTPLIALMKDQVENLKERDIKAVAIFSGMTKNEIDIALENCIYGDTKFLYLSPERLGTELFKTRLQNMKVNLLAIDEAHCISQWGYDFRPSYLKISEIRTLIPETPVLAVTATATPEVVEDIQEKLCFKEKNVLQKSFERKNLIYIVRKVEDKQKYLLKILNSINGTGIVYVRSRKKTRDISLFLKKNKISADYYHAGLSNETRERKQHEWKSGRNRVIVSTNAFGMGIDKSDVRIVVHLDLPDSIEAYFQEAGRAGRDGKKAYSVILYHNLDKIKLNQRIDRSFPDIKKITQVYNALGNYFQIAIGSGKDLVLDFNLIDFSSTYKFNILIAYNSLKILEREGYIQLTEELDNPSKIHFLYNKNDLYKFQVANASYDSFIKLLLRSYTGVFNNYAAINEKVLAKKSNTDIDTIRKYLQGLNNNKVIRYIPRKKTPLIIYTEQRLEEKALFISKKNYSDRKKRFTQRIESILNYADSDNKCRSQLLLNYFGEKNAYRCGKCDVCQKRNELNLSKYEFDLILEDIKRILKDQNATVSFLVDNISIKKEDKTLKVVQWLLDNDKIKYTNDNKLTWD